MSNKRFLIFLFLTLLVFFQSFAQEEKFKAVLLFNFTKYIEWSPADKQGYFIIAVVGSQEMTRHLEIIAEKMKVGNQPIMVRYYSSASEVEKCHMVYLASFKSSEFNTLIQKFPHNNMFFVTDKNGMIGQGSCINFYSKNGEVKFEISKENINKTGLKINPALLILGKST
jgi:hypothetical protein